MHITTNSHTLYIYIFHYYLIPALDYTVIISFLLFAPYFFRGCTVIISFLLFAPYFFRDCTVIIPFLLFAPYFCDDCTVIIPFLLFAPYFCDDCTVIIHISFLCIVFLSNISSNIKNKRIVEINDSDCRQSPAFAGFCYCWSRFSDIINIRRAVFFYDDQKRR